jgi:hypothetical protein
LPLRLTLLRYLRVAAFLGRREGKESRQRDTWRICRRRDGYSRRDCLKDEEVGFSMRWGELHNVG